MSQAGEYKQELKDFRPKRDSEMENYNNELRKGSRFQHNKKFKNTLKKK